MAREALQGIYFKSGGHRLLGTLFVAAGEDPKPTAVILHGCPGIEKNHDVAVALRDQGWNSLIFHFRGSWGSEGVYTLRTLPDDVRAALDDMSSGRHAQVDPEQLILVGHSLGGWAGIIAAATDTRPKAVAVYGGVVDLRQRGYTPEYIAGEFTPWLRGITPKEFVRQVEELDDGYSPLMRVASLSPRPLLVLHGGADSAVPPEQARLLFDRARDPREYILVPDADHSFSWHRRELIDHLMNWVGRLRLG